MARRRREKRMPYISDRRLFGEMTCRIGGCGRDGTCEVMVPCIQYGSVDEGYREKETWVPLIRCERHAKHLCETGEDNYGPI